MSLDVSYRENTLSSPCKADISRLCEVCVLLLRSCHVWSLCRHAALGVVLATLGLCGCSPVFNVRAAREVSRDRLLGLADRGRTDHLWYVGSDEFYHYVADTRSGHEGSYKVRADEVRLSDTFRIGDDQGYVLWPWLIEGKRLGRRPRELPIPHQPVTE
jgi:hypothetical protein